MNVNNAPPENWEFVPSSGRMMFQNSLYVNVNLGAYIEFSLFATFGIWHNDCRN